MALIPGTRPGVPAIDREGYRPAFFRLAIPADAERLEALLDRDPHIQVFDELDAQLEELIRSLEPARRFDPAALQAQVARHLGPLPKEQYGVWVHYPWSRRLVHILDEAEFALVRTDRNRNKITRQEQEKLSTLKVGVIGLSVGQSVSLAMALERTFGELRIADFDRLDLSNLNRIRSGIHQLGLNKCVNVAREIAEIDPFLKVTCFTEGVTTENVDRFFNEGGRLDLLVEECDSVDIKIIARQKARELRVPVVMDTSDRGMIDVERFDLEPQRPILHGLIAHLDPQDAARAKTNEEKLPFLAPIAGLATLSPRMKASMLEIGQSISTWPQLGSNVSLGGAITADVCRRIALGQFTASGRWRVDLEELIADPIANDTATRDEGSRVAELTMEAMEAIAERLASEAPSLAIDPTLARSLAQAATLAPSAGNAQPWRFLLHEGRLLVFHDHARSVSRLDPEYFIGDIGVGMCIENIVQHAGEHGAHCDTRLFPLNDEPRLVAVITVASKTDGRIPTEHGDLADQITRRHTNRQHGDGGSIDSQQLKELECAVENIEGAMVHVISGREPLNELGRICGVAERIRVLNPHGHRDFFQRELRWSTEEAQRSGDGIDIQTLEMSLVDRTGLEAASDDRAMATVRALHGGTAFEKHAREAINSSSAVALVSMPGTALHYRVLGGRAAQRLWLKASQLGLAVHPISAVIFLAHHIRHGDGGAFIPSEREEILSLFDGFGRIFSLKEREPVFMVRLFNARPVTTRSLRRPLEKVFDIARLQPA